MNAIPVGHCLRPELTGSGRSNPKISDQDSINTMLITKLQFNVTTSGVYTRSLRSFLKDVVNLSRIELSFLQKYQEPLKKD